MNGDYISIKFINGKYYHVLNGDEIIYVLTLLMGNLAEVLYVKKSMVLEISNLLLYVAKSFTLFIRVV